MRRAGAWGASTIWMGCGPCPPDGTADHLVWAAPDLDGVGGVDGVDGSAVHDGRFVLLYHVLWELTHVCFEHPGLLTPSNDGENDGNASTMMSA